MKMRSTTGKDIKVSLLSGHTIHIPAEGSIDIPPRFQRRAVELGALPHNVPDLEEEEHTPPTKSEQIEAGLRQMLNSDEEGSFTEQGKPNLNMLSKRIGFRVQRTEVEPVWAKIEKEIMSEGDSDNDDQGDEGDEDRGDDAGKKEE